MRSAYDAQPVVQDTNTSVRVRFAPSPTGYLHIGGARTALFNWLLARKHGGAFLLRIEDTDQARNVEDSLKKILEDLRWLGLQWDEGPEVGGPCGPYFQSQRLDLYDRYCEKLLHSGRAYYALETPEELAALRESSQKQTGGYRYRRPDPLPTIEQGLAAKAAGRPVVVRFKMPDTDITVFDDILGQVTLAADQLEDFVIVKGDGFPTYHFACVVDDELMNITHVLRGQEHLMNTPKHVAMQQALGFRTPRYGHMPVIFNMDGTKMSKRDKERALARGEKPPEIDVHDFRVAGYLPEAVINFIALLGWSPGDDREHFDRDALTELFTVERVGRTNAKFDRAKLLAFNTHWAAAVPPERLLSGFKDFVSVNGHPAGKLEDATLAAILKACAGFRVFTDVLEKTRFLYVDDDALAFDLKAVEKVLAKDDGAGFRTLRAVQDRLCSLGEWSAQAIDAMIEDYCAQTQVKMGHVAQPLRVAVTGSTISPSIGQTLELLGRERSLKRIRRCLEMRR